MIGWVIGGVAVLWAIGEVKKANPPKIATAMVNQLPGLSVNRNVVTGEAFIDGSDWNSGNSVASLVPGMPETSSPLTYPPVKGSRPDIIF